MKAKTEIWWCVKNGAGWLLPWTASCQRKGAIENFCGVVSKEKWAEARKRGCTVVKIEVKEQG